VSGNLKKNINRLRNYFLRSGPPSRFRPGKLVVVIGGEEVLHRDDCGITASHEQEAVTVVADVTVVGHVTASRKQEAPAGRCRRSRKRVTHVTVVTAVTASRKLEADRTQSSQSSRHRDAWLAQVVGRIETKYRISSEFFFVRSAGIKFGNALKRIRSSGHGGFLQHWFQFATSVTFHR
jgi:hypothetical protein